MIPWDLSQNFINALLGWDVFTPLGPNHPTQFDPYFGEDPTLYRPLTAYLFNNAEHRRRYSAHLRTVINELDTNQIRAEALSMQSLAYTAVDSDPNKLFSISNYIDNVEQDLSFLGGEDMRFGGIIVQLKESNFSVSHPEISAAPPIIYNVEVNGGVVTANVNNESYVSIMATLSEYNSKFQNLVSCMTTEQMEVTTANDRLYSYYMPFSFLRL